MPKYYCEYCDIYLMHSSLAGRRQHNAGRKHINNKIEFYQNLIREKGVTPPMYPAPPALAARLRATKALQAQMAAQGQGTGVAPGVIQSSPTVQGAKPLALPGLPGMGGAAPGGAPVTIQAPPGGPPTMNLSGAAPLGGAAPAGLSVPMPTGVGGIAPGPPPGGPVKVPIPGGAPNPMVPGSVSIPMPTNPLMPGGAPPKPAGMPLGVNF